MGEKNNLFFGSVEFSGIGGYREKMISELIENGIQIRNTRFSEIEVTGEVSPFDYYKTAETARKNGVRIRAQKRRGLYFTLVKYKTRAGLYVGLLIFILILSLWQTRVQDISIRSTNGDDSFIHKPQILEILSECGIVNGAATRDLRVYEAEQRIMLEVEGCSWVDVSYEGFRVIVKLSKGIDPPELAGTEPRNIVASRPAMIVSQSVYQGASVVNNGSGVNTGDMLVSGIFPDGGEHILTVRADAEIIGEWDETAEFFVPYNETINVPDGEQKTFKYLVWNDDVYPLFLGKAFAENSVYSEEDHALKLFDIDLPFKLRVGTYTAYTEKQITRSPETAVSELEKQRENYEENFFSDFEIVTYNERYYPEDDGITLIVDYTLQGDITKPVPIEFDPTQPENSPKDQQTDDLNR